MALHTELARRLIDVERVAGAELAELVARRLALVEAALRALAPAEPGWRDDRGQVAAGLTGRAPVRRPGGVPDGVDAPVELGFGGRHRR